MTAARLAEQRRMLPAVAFARLWENQWSTGGGDALTSADIEAAFSDELAPMTRRERGYLFVVGVDLGLTRDGAAVVALAVPEGGHAGRIRLAGAKLWRPILGRKINLLDVERYILDLDEEFGLEFVAFDPWQAEHLSQTLEADSGHRRRNARRVFGGHRSRIFSSPSQTGYEIRAAVLRATDQLGRSVQALSRTALSGCLGGPPLVTMLARRLSAATDDVGRD